MSSKILLKKSTTASSVPLTSDLDVGEVAINTEDKRLYTKDSGGSVVEVSTTPSTIAVTGNATVGGTMGVTGNTTVGGTLGVTGATTLGTATVSTKLTVPTPTDSTDAASKGYVDTEISSAVTNVIDSAPGALDTLNELAAALGDDPNFATTVTNALATKAPLASPALTGTPTAPTAAADTNTTQIATTAYVQTEVADYLPLAGGTLSGALAMGTNKITGLGTPTVDTDAVTKLYVDTITGDLQDAADSAADAEKLAINPEDSEYTLSDGTTTGFSALHYAAKASDSATSASDAQTAAEAAQTAAETAYDNFDDRYLGAKATAPAFDNDGQALITGALYFDTTAGAMYVYDGSAWDQVALTPGDFLTVNNNLSDLSNTATAISNLGITATAAELNYTDGVTSNIQTQIDNIDVDPTKGTLTKSFANGETASITLSGAISPAPVVSVTKEVAQTGITSKGGWDVATDGSNYELHDTAYDTTLTPGQIGFQDASTWSYDSVTFNVSGQTPGVQGLVFNDDGTKMYTVGNAGDRVAEYALTTAYDISTASHTVNFSVSSQDLNPQGVAFNNDGTKMYVTGGAGQDVNEYALSTGFDVSTATFTDTFSVSAQASDPFGIAFNADGTKMFVVGANNDSVHEYAVSTAFDVSTSTFTQSFSVASQDSTPKGIAFNSDGTKMYIVGNVGVDVNYYALTTGFDVSTASFVSNFSVSSQEATPTGIAFKPDGTKMYVVGETSDLVHQYSVGSEALILGSGSFASTDVGKRIVGNGGEAILTATDGSYSVVTAFDDSSTIASGDWSMFALTFDGTDGVAVNTLVQGFADASTWSYDSKSLNVSSQDSSPQGVTVSPDGTKLYIAGSTNDTIYQYSMSTAYDLATASYDSVSLSVSSQDTSPAEMVFNNDGTEMFLVGSATKNVFKYSLSTAYDLSTASYSSVSFSVNSQATNPQGLAFNNDGTKLYISDRVNSSIHQYSLSTGYDLTTASYDSVSLDVSSQLTIPQDVKFNSDGTKMFLVGQSAFVYQYSLSTAFDLSTASYDNVSFSTSSQGTDLRGLSFSSDGTKLYVASNSTDTVFQYSTGTLFTPTNAYHPTVTKTSGQISTEYWTDINTMTADETLNGGEVYYAVSTDDRTTWAVIDNTDGVRPIVRNNAGTWEYNTAVGTAGFGDASGWSYDSVSFSVSSQETQPSDILFNNDGTKMYVVGLDSDAVYQYTLSTAFNVSTASYDSVSLSISGQDATVFSMVFNTDGTKLYIVGDVSNDVFQYTLSTAFDLSTASYASLSFATDTQVDVPEGLAFNANGTKMFVGDRNSATIYQYTLSTAENVSTASYDSVNFSVSSQEGTLRAFAFNADGTKLYAVGSTNDTVYQYSLSTGFDLSTASYDSISFSVGTQSAVPLGIRFNSDGEKVYIVDYTTSTIYQYSSTGPGYGTSTTWTSATINDELYALQEALEEQQFNRMNSTQLNAVTDPNHYTLGDTLDLAIMLYTESAGSIPESDGVSINYDAEALNQGAVVGTDYDFDFPDSTTVRITSNAAQNLKIRVV